MDHAYTIDGIFNYCNRRCEHCAFTERCGLFLDMREYQHQHPDRGPVEQTHDKFHEVFRMLEQWCKGEGIDFDELQREANTGQTNADFERHQDAIRADPLQILASGYAHAAMKLVDGLSTARSLRTWPHEVVAAIDTIAWNAGMVAAKVYRTLGGFAARHDWSAGNAEDPTQNIQSDWNGSAKLARLIVAESKDAWRVVMEAGEATPDSPLTELVSLLDRIDTGLAERFPQAMEFVRPGFDQPSLLVT